MHAFTDDELQTIYAQIFKRPTEYFRTYEDVPQCPVKAWDYSWGDADFPRVWCILDFQEWMKKYNISAKWLAYTCSADPELEFIPSETKQLLSYPDYDLHKIGESFTNTFDFFLFSQTIEHLYNPQVAVENIYRTLKPGGYVFTSVPTLNIPHYMPYHFSGWTPFGLVMLFKLAGFEVLEVGQWGNSEYITRLFLTHQWPGYNTLQTYNRVPNEERNVCQCWILARRPQ
jgi:SAM-dependent methyltransferase